MPSVYAQGEEAREVRPRYEMPWFSLQYALELWFRSSRREPLEAGLGRLSECLRINFASGLVHLGLSKDLGWRGLLVRSPC